MCGDSLKDLLSSNEVALRFHIEHRFVPDSDIKQEWVDHTRKLVTRIRAELQRREGGFLNA
jgi:hypothetical protein